MSCNSNRMYKSGLKEFGYRMFITLMVFGIIGGGIFSFHGEVFGYVLFVIGLICVPFYMHDLLSTKNKESDYT